MKKAIKYVINRNGSKIYFESALELMDSEIYEILTNLNDFKNEQEFFSAYEKSHIVKYGEEWELSKENPCY